MKKFVNNPENFVPEFMAGVVAANPDLLEALPEFQLIKRKDRPAADKVSATASLEMPDCIHTAAGFAASMSSRCCGTFSERRKTFTRSMGGGTSTSRR